nr:MAG TPA: hypothetical protein [Caudoviricetes sp.]
MKPSRLRFKKEDQFVKMYVRQLLRKAKTLEDVPEIGNLKDVVKAEVERIEREYEEKHKKAVEEVTTPKEVVTEAPKEVVVTPAPVSEQPKVEEAPKEVVTPTPAVSETPKETTETERKEEHAE